MLKYFHSLHKYLNGLITYLHNSTHVVNYFDNAEMTFYVGPGSFHDINSTLLTYLQCHLTCMQHYCMRMHRNFLDTAVNYPDVRSLLHSYVKFASALQMFFNMHV